MTVVYNRHGLEGKSNPSNSLIQKLIFNETEVFVKYMKNPNDMSAMKTAVGKIVSVTINDGVDTYSIELYDSTINSICKFTDEELCFIRAFSPYTNKERKVIDVLSECCVRTRYVFNNSDIDLNKYKEDIVNILSKYSNLDYEAVTVKAVPGEYKVFNVEITMRR